MKRDPVDAMMLGIVIGLVACFLGGCCKTCPPPAPPVVIQEKVSACLKKAPPAAPPYHLEPGAEGTPCYAAGFEACATRENATALFLYLSAVQSWQRDAWNACGVLPKPTPPAAAK